MSYKSDRDRADYYAARVVFLTAILNGNLSPKQRRGAEAERMAANIKRLMAETRISRSNCVAANQ